MCNAYYVLYYVSLYKKRIQALINKTTFITSKFLWESFVGISFYFILFMVSGFHFDFEWLSFHSHFL